MLLRRQLASPQEPDQLAAYAYARDQVPLEEVEARREGAVDFGCAYGFRDSKERLERGGE